MKLRLLVDLEVIEALQQLPVAQRKLLLTRFRAIQDFPANYSDYSQPAEHSMRVDVNVCGNWAIHYWADHNDRHVKVLKLLPLGR
ncbi:hypothetical protein [Roseimicrobium sp. ORNL1]|uniref:hypothetical protein n=1 Tax=Roseimicrobium sp. ORNL1 TaxID=2711231 RepID=UPI0013E1A0B6|nr:hypothetical protein [Roseimicrobium sp. ORNL1]QIF05170.1 hypothetical protein G5S37_27870 [Roseimicrobium sp. ORNL1]